MHSTPDQEIASQNSAAQEIINSPLQRVLITAGGTGGHIFPGLAVAEVLRQKNVEVQWVGTDYGLEKNLVPKANIPIHYLPVRGLRGKGLGRLFAMPLMLLKSISQSRRLIKEFQPQVVLSLGGYASGPLALAAKTSGIPLIVHEQNAAPGLTNRVLAPMSAKVLAGLPSKLSSLSQYQEIGNPVRQEFVDLHSRQQASSKQKGDGDEINVLIVGGSQGAQKLNLAVPIALQQIQEQYPDQLIRVVHQAGASKHEMTQNAYDQTHVRVDVVEFIDDMAGAFEWADIIIGRAGALTVAEVATAGVACLFIPLAIAVDDHQTLNARSLVDRDAALMVSEAELEGDALVKGLEILITDHNARKTIAQKALELAKVNAAHDIVAAMEQLIQK